MHDARFFETTRGRIVAALRRRHGATAVELAAEFGLSANAVRQQLVFLERDGYVLERSVKRGPTKPTLEYSLTGAAETLFPQRYDRILNAVLREVREEGGDSAVVSLFDRMGKRAADRYSERFKDKDTRGRVYELSEILREGGVEADVVETKGGFELREHNCPYAKTVAEHPEVCRVIHTVLHETMPGEPVQVESLATGGHACRFEIEGAIS
ncbi:MAG: winged helix-turn-helix transcriptional regulator [Candidatus Eremiobacteraeota bacterium]|nr:winged helix-turn-helix transcriptional regulator [Candidatus Eremiobacteraeota bacterium]